jgi:hypothetical protein
LASTFGQISVTALRTRRFHLAQDRVRDPVPEQFPARSVPHAPVLELVHELLELISRQAPAPRSPGQDHRGVRRNDLCPQRPAQHLRHPRVGLDHRRLIGIGSLDTDDRLDQVGDRGLPDVEFAQRGQNVSDVGQEGRVRPDDHHAAARDQFLVRVQQVGDAVQADGGLPGAGRALHAHGARRVRPHDVVLLGLDGGDDVAHRTGARPLDLRD